MSQSRISISNDGLVAAGKSSRLEAIRKKVISSSTVLGELKPNKASVARGLKKEESDAIQQARGLVEEKIVEIMQGFPGGKKKTFFKLRYGQDVDKLKLLPIKTIFSILHLNKTTIPNYRLIENRDVNGNKV